MTQPAKLLTYLQEHGSITRLEAVQQLGIMNLWTRVADLEKLGYIIGRENIKVPTRDGKQATVTRYSLVSEPEQQVAYG